MNILFKFYAASSRSMGRAALAAFTVATGSMPSLAALVAQEPLFFFSGVT